MRGLMKQHAAEWHPVKKTKRRAEWGSKGHSEHILSAAPAPTLLQLSAWSGGGVSGPVSRKG
jgi:hypothetical protein